MNIYSQDMASQTLEKRKKHKNDDDQDGADQDANTGDDATTADADGESSDTTTAADGSYGNATAPEADIDDTPTSIDPYTATDPKNSDADATYPADDDGNNDGKSSEPPAMNGFPCIIDINTCGCFPKWVKLYCA